MVRSVAALHTANCEEAHSASDKRGFYYKLEAEILSTKTKDKLSYGEAKRFVKPEILYSQALINSSIQVAETENNRTLPRSSHKQ